jgi:pimeloyl-ACP methyl ester carboxylesterase
METHTLPDGRLLRYMLRHEGAAGEPPLVFLNGLSQTTVAWGQQVHRLKEKKGTLVYDASGQGRSSPPPPGSRPIDHAYDLLDLLETLELSLVDLCGFSFGSRIAMRLALLAPERVRRMVLIGAAHRETVLRRWIVKGWLDALNTGGLEHCFRIVTPSIVGESWLAKHEWMHDNMLAAFVRRNHPESMRRLLADTLLEGGDFTAAELGRIPHPILVLRGADDIVVPRFLNDEMVEQLPDARFDEIDDCAHTVAIEQPDWTAAHLASFLVGE